MLIDSQILATNFQEYAGKEVTINGWIKTNRDQKEFGFIALNDGLRLENIQVIYETSLSNFADVAKLNSGASISVTGVVVLTPDRAQSFEIKASQVKIIKNTDPDYPIQPKRHTREFLREHLELRPRTNLFNAVFRTRSVLAHAIHTFFQEKGFIYLNSPIITSNDGEGAGEMFVVSTLKPGQTDYRKDFFEKKANLTVTGQLHAEAYAQAFQRVYTFGPTFRAEKSNTPKHAAEFWMVEPEIAFFDLEKDMALAEEMVKFLVNEAFIKLQPELTLFNKFVEPGLIDRLTEVKDKPFARVTHAEAIDILKKAKVKFENEPKHGQDIFTEHEKYLTDVYFKSPVFIYNWPKEIKAFYMKQNDDMKTVAACDLLVAKSGELIGGSQREDDYDKLLSRMQELKMDIEPLKWYLDLRRHGGTQSAGFGLGFERLVMFITGIENIRDVVPFPRTSKNLNY